MSRRPAIIALILTAFLSITTSAGSSASAAPPPEHYGPVTVNYGTVEGTVFWYERSVEIKGYVIDTPRIAGATTVQFKFFGGNTYLGSETRSVTNDTLPYHFTKQGPVGGIDYIDINICIVGDGCELAAGVQR